MTKLIAGLFITLDGVVEAPGPGDTTLPEKRGWSMPYMNEEIGMEIMRDMDSSEGMLLGRTTYDGFAAFWPNIGDDDPFGKRMNGMRKYVVSKTLKNAAWNNSIVVDGCLFVFGGEGPTMVFPNMEMFVPELNRWFRLESMPTAVHGVTGAAFLNGWIHLPGGGIHTGGSSGSVLHQVFWVGEATRR